MVRLSLHTPHGMREYIIPLVYLPKDIVFFLGTIRGSFFALSNSLRRFLSTGSSSTVGTKLIKGSNASSKAADSSLSWLCRLEVLLDGIWSEITYKRYQLQFKSLADPITQINKHLEKVMELNAEAQLQFLTVKKFSSNTKGLHTTFKDWMLCSSPILQVVFPLPSQCVLNGTMSWQPFWYLLKLMIQGSAQDIHLEQSWLSSYWLSWPQLQCSILSMVSLRTFPLSMMDDLHRFRLLGLAIGKWA